MKATAKKNTPRKTKKMPKTLSSADKQAITEAVDDLVKSGQIVVSIKYPKITDEKKQALELKIDKARWKCLTNSAIVFYGQLMMNLKDELTYAIPTACTNGKLIKWNPVFLEKLTDEEVLYVLIHETDHCALGHLWRFDFTDTKTAQKANIACDHVINLRLNSLANLKIKMPEGGLADSKYAGLCEEEVYRLLPDQPQEKDGSEVQKGGIGDFEEPEKGGGNGEEENQEGKDGKGLSKKESLKDEWTRKIIQAAQACKSTSQGTMPSDIQRMIDQGFAQKVDWKMELSEFIKNCISTRNDYTRSPKRHSWMDVVMPRKKINNISKIIFARDVSGSVNDAQLSSFNALIAQCMAETGCYGWVFDCDSQIGKIYEVNNESEIPCQAVGGGGTDFRPVFAKAKEMIDDGEEIAGLVYISDMYGSHCDPASYPEYPVLWVSVTKDQVGPFGRTVFVDGI